MKSWISNSLLAICISILLSPPAEARRIKQPVVTLEKILSSAPDLDSIFERPVTQEQIATGVRYRIIERFYQNYFNNTLGFRGLINFRISGLRRIFNHETRFLLFVEDILKAASLSTSDISSVLDLGCGSMPYGHLLNVLFPNAAGITACDVNKGKIDEARNFINSIGANVGRFRFIASDMASLEGHLGEGEKFDLVTLFHQVILCEHLVTKELNYDESWRNIWQTFKMIENHLSDRGICVLTHEEQLFSGAAVALLQQAGFKSISSAYSESVYDMGGQGMQAYFRDVSLGINGEGQNVLMGGKEEIHNLLGIIDKLCLLEERFSREVIQKFLTLHTEKSYIGIEALVRVDTAVIEEILAGYADRLRRHDCPQSVLDELRDKISGILL